MKWREQTMGPILRKVGRGEGTVTSIRVPFAMPGDIDLSGMRTWNAVHGEFSYVIGYDEVNDCYVASARPISIPKGKIIGEDSETIIHWLVDRDLGVKSWAKAEQACKDHARGRRDA